MSKRYLVIKLLKKDGKTEIDKWLLKPLSFVRKLKKS